MVNSRADPVKQEVVHLFLSFYAFLFMFWWGIAGLCHSPVKELRVISEEMVRKWIILSIFAD